MVLVISSLSAQAQSFKFSDLFNQASKQRNYYLQQIAAYEAFEQELKMGYGVMKNGLKGIAAIDVAEFNAHTAYYKSLETPGAAVKNSNQVQDILNWNTAVTQSFNQTYNGLTAGEQQYVLVVKNNLLTACNADLTDLQSLLATGKLQLSDNERLTRLDKLHESMLDKYQFSQNFCSSLKLLAIQRQAEINNNNNLMILEH
jgi:hypothetical protein